MVKQSFLLILLLIVCNIHTSLWGAVSVHTPIVPEKNNITYHVIGIRDYLFEELIDEGVSTLARQLDVLHVPVRQGSFVIKCHIRRHHFLINKENRRKIAFRAISFIYPSVTPQGDSVMLSGLVTVPFFLGSKPSRMLIYHHLTCVSNAIAPSNSLPIAAVLTADNTICVFPDYYGCGVTQDGILPYTSLNYHARCATECALAALDIVRDIGLDLAPEFYTWNTGYSQGAGYALATHKYIETVLPDSLSRRINLHWSLCCNGIYNPSKLFESAIINNDMGTTPSIYLQALRGLFSVHQESFAGLSMRDFLSDKAIESDIDSLLLTYDDGLWDFADRLDGRDKSHSPADYFCQKILDTSTSLYKTLVATFELDDCAAGWHPKSPVVICHSKNDKTIPFYLALLAQRQLSTENDRCIMFVPKVNRSHVFSAFCYYTLLLGLNEDELFNRYCPDGM